MVEKPIDTMNVKSFLILLASGGNLIFTDSAKLQEELKNSIISTYVIQVEDIAAPNQ
jgi:hypothetical protein